MSRFHDAPLEPDPFAGGLPALGAGRVRLRAVRTDEAPDVLRIFGDPEATRYWSHAPLETMAEAEAYVADMVRNAEQRRLFQWVIARPDDRFIGTVTLFQWDRTNRRAEVGYMLDPAEQGRGLATDAVRAVLSFGFDVLGLHRVEADTDPDNAPSMRLLERLGFRREGYFRERWYIGGRYLDSVMFGLLREDFPG